MYCTSAAVWSTGSLVSVLPVCFSYICSSQLTPVHVSYCQPQNNAFNGCMQCFRPLPCAVICHFSALKYVAVPVAELCSSTRVEVTVSETGHKCCSDLTVSTGILLPDIFVFLTECKNSRNIWITHGTA